MSGKLSREEHLRFKNLLFSMGYEFYNRNDGLFAYFKLLLKKVFDILWKFLKTISIKY